MVRRPDRPPRRTLGESIHRRLAAWFVGSGIGVAILALPDSDDRVFSLSRTHGPSPLDLLGLVVLVTAWAPVAAVLWVRRRALTGRSARAALMLGVVGLVGLVLTVRLDLGPLYLGPVALLVAAQIAALHVVARHPGG